MKENNKRVVFYSAEKDGFLESYKDRGSLVFKAVFDDRLWKALQLPIEFYEKQKNELDKLAEAFGCEVLNVEVEYNVTKLDGSDFERTERNEVTRDEIKAFLRKIINQLIAAVGGQVLKNMATLYELTGVFLQIDEMDIDDETKLDTLDSIDWEHGFSEKIENCIKVIRNKDARVEAYKAEIKRLEALKKSESKAIEEIKKRISEAMRLTQHDKLDTILFKVGFRKSEAVVVDETKLPKKYQVATYKPDKKTLKELLKSGKHIKGAVLEERSNLSIR